jgi:hypothetical protein
MMKVNHETLRVHRNVISTFVLILFGDKHQLTNLHDRQDDNMLEDGKCRNFIEDPTVTVKVRTHIVTNNSKGRGTHGFILNRQMI